MKHSLQQHFAYWLCTVCRQSWKGVPVSECPGAEVVESWEAAATNGLLTRTQLHKLRLAPAPGAEPAALKKHYKGYYELFRKEVAVALPAKDERRQGHARQAALTRRTCSSCGDVVEAEGELIRRRDFICETDPDHKRLCWDCYGEAWRAVEDRRIAVVRAELVGMFADPAGWAVLDFETCGLDEPAVLEVAVVAGDGTVLFDELVDPRHPIDPAAQGVHRLTLVDVFGRPSWPATLPRLKATLARAGVAVLVAWGEFEDLVIRWEGRRDPHARWRVAIVDLMDWWRELQPDPPRIVERRRRRDDDQPPPHVSLSEACHALGVSPGTHRARPDCLATLGVLRKLLEVP